MTVFFKSIAIQSINIFMKEMNTSELLFHAKYVTNQSQFEFIETIKDFDPVNKIFPTFPHLPLGNHEYSFFFTKPHQS